VGRLRYVAVAAVLYLAGFRDVVEEFLHVAGGGEGS